MEITLKSASFTFEDDKGNKYDVVCPTEELEKCTYIIFENGIKKREMVLMSGHANKSLARAVLLRHFALEKE